MPPGNGPVLQDCAPSDHTHTHTHTRGQSQVQVSPVCPNNWLQVTGSREVLLSWI